MSRRKKGPQHDNMRFGRWVQSLDLPVEEGLWRLSLLDLELWIPNPSDVGKRSGTVRAELHWLKKESLQGLVSVEEIVLWRGLLLSRALYRFTMSGPPYRGTGGVETHLDPGPVYSIRIGPRQGTVLWRRG